jgi:hypothetical protein
MSRNQLGNMEALIAIRLAALIKQDSLNSQADHWLRSSWLRILGAVLKIMIRLPAIHRYSQTIYV